MDQAVIPTMIVAAISYAILETIIVGLVLQNMRMVVSMTTIVAATSIALGPNVGSLVHLDKWVYGLTAAGPQCQCS
jgi:hypothetical protein